MLPASSLREASHQNCGFAHHVRPSNRKHLERNTHLLFEIGFANLGRLLRCPRLVRNPIEFDHCPPTESHLVQRREDGGKIDVPTSEFNELERISRFGRIGGNVANVLEMKEENAFVILLNSL